ncbi:hypothetical protein A2382_03675 [Candidatus Woesebacteria bacterium RIFOXYB1_FULL_38_16]|uniref:Glycosyltransferase RgtA/B/C/D-like domain-containing protein n=1 Tax=Candidatus Woesebacteria bacterium RIFOXYB1_FULL_38_16 TaxID=1802538 RepID=A0A1F8CR26_9BACT|nr:MAG: hypothetical protein A2382_03675 [Candidatus Woesebacteria bacterium RIFOXYB1_FULL_38_16]
MLVSILSIVIFSSSLAKILSDFFVYKLGLNFFLNQFSNSIPSFSSELGITKTLDLTYFSLLISISILLFGLYSFVAKSEKNHITILDTSYLSFSLLLFLQTHFVRHSGKEVLIFFVIIELLYLLAKKKYRDYSFSNWIITANGFLSGFFVMLVVRQFTTSILWVVGVIIFVVTLYHLLARDKKYKFVTSPFHVILTTSALFPWNNMLLFLLGILTGVGLLSKKTPLFLEKNKSLIYSLALFFMISYDPLFYFGNLDSVEEGFWLAWLQRLISGQTLYKDVAVYHPPGIIWGLGFFVKIFGESVYSVRLYFHILKLIGLGIIFLSLRKLLQTKLNIILSSVLILSYVTGFVRNNIEIRLGLGLLGIYLLMHFFEKRKLNWLILSGVATGIATCFSLETGIAAFIASIVGILIFDHRFKNTLKSIYIWFMGIALPLGLVAGVLISQRALRNALSQIIFYAKAFSLGYFNVGVPRSELYNILQWWRVEKYIDSSAVVWEISTWFLAIALIYLFYKAIKREFVLKDKFAGMLGVYCLVLSRVALGRSDWYHLLFVLIIEIILLVYVLESMEKDQRRQTLSIGLWIILGLVVNRSLMQEFINRQIFKLQSYANISQTYKQYKTPRAKIAMDIDAPADSTDALIDFLQTNTSESDKIFTYPWNPELYFLANRNNATSFDTPYSFFTIDYQNQIIKQLEEENPKYVIFNPDMNFASMSVGSLSEVQKYLNSNFEPVTTFGKEKVLTKK